jgi:glycosyltransferase involved in cell wall biosynthesis
MTSTLRVLHAAAEIAGQPALLCRGLRARGIDARSLAFGATWQRYPSDLRVDGGGALGLLRRLRALLEHGRRVDILHLHFGTSFLPRLVDLGWFRRRGTHVVFHHHGCDVRPRSAMLARHAVSACSECPVYCSPVRQARVRRAAARHGALEIVSTPDLLEVVPGAVHLPVAIDVATWEGLRRQATGPGRRDWVILHAPSEPSIKGTRHVVAAVEALARERPDVRLELVQGMPAAEARRRFGVATVVVDQLHMGWHGLFAVEAMALGKPVLCYIRPDLRDHRPGMPVVPTTRETLVDDLRALHDDAGRVQRLGVAGIEYAGREHGLDRISARLAELYESRVLGVRAS